MEEDWDAPTWREIERLYDAAKEGEGLLEASEEDYPGRLEDYRAAHGFSTPYEELRERLFVEYEEMDEAWDNLRPSETPDTVSIDERTDEVWDNLRPSETPDTVSIAEGVNNKGKASGKDLYHRHGFVRPMELDSVLKTMDKYLVGLYNLYSDEGAADQRFDEDKDEMMGLADDISGLMWDLQPLFIDDE